MIGRAEFLREERSSALLDTQVGKIPEGRVKHVKTFAFIAHYVEPWNWLLNFRAFGFLHRRPQWRYLLFPLFPLCWLMSVVYLMRRKPFQVVDHYRVVEGLHGYTILINNFAWHFLFRRYQEMIRQRILAAALYAQNELKAEVVGLGALTKAETVTHGGVWLALHSGIRVPVVHGDTCTAWFVIELLQKLTGGKGRGSIAMIGPTSKVGRAVMLHLAKRGFIFKAFTRSRDRFLEIQLELPEPLRGNLVHIDDLRQARDCRIWITGKSKPDGKSLLAAISDGATVVNFAVPDPLTGWDLRLRPDLDHIEGGLVQTPSTCTMRFAMRLTPGITYACTAGTMVHAACGWSEPEVAEVDMHRLEAVAQESVRLGLTLPR